MESVLKEKGGTNHNNIIKSNWLNAMPFSPSYDIPDERQAYTFNGGPIGCLVLHGFLGSPGSSRPLGEYLSGKGLTVHCPLLPGHGEYPNKLVHGSKEKWIGAAEEGLKVIRQQCEEVFYLGHSMGTVLSAYLAVKELNPQGMIMLAPVDKLPDKRLHLFRVLRYVMPWLYPMKFSRLKAIAEDRMRDFDPDIDLEDPAVIERLPEITRVPTRSIDEMRKTVEMGRTLWPKVEAPAVILQGGEDIAASAEDARRVFGRLTIEDKHFLLFESAGHELMRPLDPNHEQVWLSIFEFIRERSSL